MTPRANLLIVKNGAKFMQEGDSPAPIAPFLLTSFGSGPLLISDSGKVLWYGDWDDPDTTVDTGLFVDGALLVQEGVTTLGGEVIDTLRGIQDGYAMSGNGCHILFEAMLANGDEVAVHVEFGGPITPVPGCAGNLATLSHTSGASCLGGSVGLALDGAQAIGAQGLIGMSATSLTDSGGCGIVLPFTGELLIGLVPKPALFPLGAWAGSPLGLQLPVPPDPTLTGGTVHLQGVFLDAVGPEPVRLSTGVDLTVGS